MSSGVGVFTQKGRCNPFWMEFLKCKNTNPDPKVQCQDYIEDYLECLHHKKEKERMITVIRELEAKEKTAASTRSPNVENPQ